MTLTKLMKGTALGALAAALAFTALPAPSHAADAGQRTERLDREPSRVRIERGNRQQAPQRREMRQERREEQREARQERREDIRERRSDRRENIREQRQERRIDNAREARQDAREQAIREAARREARDRRVDGRNTRFSGDRNRSYGDQRRGRDFAAEQAARIERIRREARSEQRRDDIRDARRDRREDIRDARRDRRSRYYDGRSWHNYDRWDTSRWRDNRRYDWRGYRSHNRNLYRPGQYYSPYRNYRYNRLNVGIRLGSSFYGSRYWINDPWRYRLPEVYGPYRWVRYYDDVLLVDVYNGEVVDVIYDFFW